MAETLVEPGLSPGRPLLCMASRLYRDQQPLVLFALAMLLLAIPALAALAPEILTEDRGSGATGAPGRLH